MGRRSWRFGLVGAVLFMLAVSAAAQQSYFPDKAFSKDRRASNFKAEWYSSQLAALEEPSLLKMAGRSTTETYRFVWLRTFNHPVSVRLDVHRDGTGTLTTKVASGAGGYKPGKLVTNLARNLSKEETQRVIDRIERANLWSLPGYLDKQGLDGSEWVIEGVSQGSYHVISRWSPEDGPVYDMGTMFVFDLAHLSVPKNEIY